MTRRLATPAVRAVGAHAARRRWRGLLALGLALGLVGGVVAGALTVARRTATAYDRLRVATAIDDARGVVFSGTGLTERLIARPEVRQARTATLAVARVDTAAVMYSSVLIAPAVEPGGEALFEPVLIAGRAVDPARIDEVVVVEAYARALGLRPGDRLPLWFLTGEEVTQFDVGFGEPDGPRVDMVVTGIVRVPGGGSQYPIMTSPAFADALDPALRAADLVLMRLAAGVRVEQVQRAADELARDAPVTSGAEEFAPIQVGDPAVDRATARATARVLTGGLLALAAVGLLSGLVAGTQAFARHHAADAADQRVERALGMTRAERVAARAAAALIAAGAAAVVTAAGGLVAGRIEPLGAVARYEPSPGWAPNLALVAAVAAASGVTVLALAALTAARAATDQTTGLAGSRSTVLATYATRPTAVAGVMLALAPARGRPGSPARSSVAGTVLGVTGVIAAVTFTTSLGRLADEPTRWGWQSDVVVVDAHEEVMAALREEPRIVALTHGLTRTVRTGGRDYTAEALTPERGRTGWTVLAGRVPERDGEVMLGPLVAKALDVAVGDEAVFDGPGGEVRCTVVGLGLGAPVNPQSLGRMILTTPAGLEALGRSNDFELAYVRVVPGAEGRALIDELASRYEIDTPHPPPEVENLRELGRLPQLLGVFVAAVALGALVHGVSSTVRRHQVDLAVLRALGFTPRQVRDAIAVAGVTVMAIGLVVGVPFGYALGRLVWWSVADAIGVATDAVRPLLATGLVAAAALAVSVLVTALPARRALATARGARRE